MDLIAKLNKALKFGSNSSPATLIHDNETAILAAATQVLNKSETGRALLEFASETGIRLHVLKNKKDFGFLPGKSEVYISCPAGQNMPTPRAVIFLAGALRQAQQEMTDVLKRPNAVTLPEDAYVRSMVAKDKDTLFTQTSVVYELSMVNGLLEIVDEFHRMGYRSLYEAYKEDVKSQERAGTR